MLLLQALVTLPQAERLTGDGIAKLLQEKSRSRAAVPLLERRLEAWREDLERDYLTQLFRKREGDLKAMMRDLGVGSTKLYAWLRKLGLSVRQLRKRL
jgi:DNA-binding NtrC family response regulator